MKQQESNESVILKQAEISTLKPGAIFIAGGKGFVVVEQLQDQTVVIENQVGEDRKFDSQSPDWSKSSLRTYLNTDVLKQYEELFGAENIIESETDLTTLDGLKDFGTCMDKIRLMSFEERRKYQALYDHSEEWEWLITPWSTKARGINYSVCCVSVYGLIDDIDCDGDNAVRPLCILKSNILVSTEE